MYRTLNIKGNIMKKYSVIIMSAVLIISSCTTGAGAGAYAGSSLGSILGSAIGGIAGGPRGSDIGTIVGMAGGALVGGAVGNAAEQKQREEQHDMLARRNQRIQNEKVQRQQQRQSSDDCYINSNTQLDPSQMVDNTNSGDDRIDFGTSQNYVPKHDYSLQQDYTPQHDYSSQSYSQSRVENRFDNSAANGNLTISNVRFVDSDGDGVFSANEIGKVTFEIHNNTPSIVYNFDPTVVEADSNKRIHISPSVRVENISPGQGLRYTATVKADRRVKNGEIRLLVSAQKDGKPISYVTVLKVNTQKQ